MRIRPAAVALTLSLTFIPLRPATGAQGEMITFRANDETVRAYLVKPTDRGAPGIVVIQEWWGLNDQIRGVVDRFAALGYAAIAPDLYRGKVATEPDLAHELMRGLNEDRAVAIVKGAAARLRSLEGGAGRPVGTIGFCMGGRLSLATALKGGDVQAAVMFYGSVETTPEAVARLACPLLGIFGEQDQGIPVEDVRKFEQALKTAGKKATVMIYPGVGHAFFNEERPSYNKTVAAEAWDLTKDFLAQNLKPKRAPDPAASQGKPPGR
jgi:carboxymethylenebutenolidase